MVLGTLTRYWSQRIQVEFPSSNVIEITTEALTDAVQSAVVAKTASSLGVLCGWLRWGGGQDRLDTALDQLDDVVRSLTYSREPSSWLLAKLCADAATHCRDTAVRSHLSKLIGSVDEIGRIALERYARQSYLSARAMFWPSQIRGIEKLTTDGSFALCTPTGSGKTTVAELGMIQGLFPPQRSPEQGNPIALYLTPSRALATEVESKLSTVLSLLSDEPVQVTGLYGGTDWGPTDAWLTSDSRTVLICTYEKAEALIRFLGPLFVSRVTTVVVDEAHTVQFDEAQTQALLAGENRALRLEALLTRLIHLRDLRGTRIIALSAVAAGIEDTLARWVATDEAGEPARTMYRSTRQLVGRLLCQPTGGFEIRYDLLDSSPLGFEDTTGAEGPFVRAPFPPHPKLPKAWEKAGPEKRLRPFLFWAAMNFAARDESGFHPGVLVSVPSKPEDYVNDLVP